MLKLRNGKIWSKREGTYFTIIAKNTNVILPLRQNYSYICTKSDIRDVPSGYAVYIIFEKDTDVFGHLIDDRFIIVENSFNYLESKDVVKIDLDNGRISTFYRENSSDNFLLVTEQCNHYCLMCSQPPKNINDGWLAEDILRAIPLFPRDANMIGLTGGEPTLLADKFFEIVKLLNSHLPDTYIHILSNGRLFVSETFTKEYADCAGENVCLGIPIYSDDPDIHNHIVQAKNAYSETIKGILNLKRHKKKVEIRVVITRLNYERLPQLAEFISKNLLFVDHVALMGLEITGFAKANLQQIWIDPTEYHSQLSESVRRLKALKMSVSVYNHQLCTVDHRIWDVCRKSISDWKNEYSDICNECGVRNECGGFFSTSTIRRSNGLHQIVGTYDEIIRST